MIWSFYCCLLDRPFVESISCFCRASGFWICHWGLKVGVLDEERIWNWSGPCETFPFFLASPLESLFFACFNLQRCMFQPCLMLWQGPLRMFRIFKSIYCISGGVVHYIFSGSKFYSWVNDNVPFQYFRSFQEEQLLAYWDADLISSLWLLKSLKQFQQTAFLASKFSQISLHLSVPVLWWRQKWTYTKRTSVQPQSTLFISFERSGR